MSKQRENKLLNYSQSLIELAAEPSKTIRMDMTRSLFKQYRDDTETRDISIELITIATFVSWMIFGATFVIMSVV